MKDVKEIQTSLVETDIGRLLIDAITDCAIYMIDPRGMITSWNPGAQRVKGYGAAEVIGSHFSIFYTEDDQHAGLPARALAASSSNGRFESEGWRVRKGGSRFWAHVMINPIRDQSGNLLGFAKVTRDLTERKRSEAALQRSEEQFRLLVQGVTDYGIFMLDRNGMISSWNSGAERMQGYSADEAIGRHFSLFYTAVDREKREPARALDIAVREGRFETEGWRVRRDGNVFRAHVVIDPIRDDEGEIIGFAKVTRDMTHFENTQTSLRNAREALFQSQKMEAIGQLTGGVAHDFNNILAAILGGLEIVQRRLPPDPNITPLLDTAVHAARRGASLTQRMLAFARRQDLKPEIIDLRALVNGMTDLIQRSLGPSVAIESRFPASLKPVYVDPNQLELAILNLVMNARDAMPDGGAITLSAHEGNLQPARPCKPADARYVCLSVTDLGDGMDEATLQRAREPFFTTKEIGKGTGLGLSMVHGLAEQSGGRLVIKSHEGEGTIAEVWLPVASTADPAQAGNVPAQARTDTQTSAEGPQNLVVLAVDDDDAVLTNTVRMLTDLGHTVLKATSADQALNIIRRVQILDLVITDHTLPGMTGMELAETIRSQWPSLPVIFGTPLADPSLVQLAKPFSPAGLIQAISMTKRLVKSNVPTES